MNVATVIRWIARTWGTAILVFVSIMLSGSLIEAGLGIEGFRNIVNFLAFPVSPVIGFGIALWREGLGGAIVIIGVAVQVILQPESMSGYWFWLGVAPPGVLYLVYWMLTRKASDDRIA